MEQQKIGQGFKIGLLIVSFGIMMLSCKAVKDVYSPPIKGKIYEERLEKNWCLSENWNYNDTILDYVHLKYTLPSDFDSLLNVKTETLSLFIPDKDFHDKKDIIFNIFVDKELNLISTMDEEKINFYINNYFSFFNRLQTLNIESPFLDRVPESVYKLKKLKKLGIFSTSKNIEIDFNKFNQMNELVQFNTYSLTEKSLCEFANNPNVKIDKIGFATFSGTSLEKKCFIFDGQLIVMDIDSFKCENFWR